MTSTNQSRGLYVETLRAILAPSRLVPIAILVTPMLLAQGAFSESRWAVILALFTASLFLLIGPYAWRVLLGRRTQDQALVPRLLLYGLLGLLPSLVGYFLVSVLGMGDTLLTRSFNNLVSAALFVVGGWGLGRDIEMAANLAAEQARTQELERMADHAQLLAMRAHLDPHFLFNTLNAIAEWCREDGAVAEQAILQLSDLLRKILGGVKTTSWPLERELEVARELFDLHLIRDPGRFEVIWALPDPLPQIEVPPLISLPLVENAFKHGPAAGHRGPIHVQSRLQDERVTLSVSNPGPFGGPREGGEGLAMVEKRLALLFEGAASFEIGDAPDDHHDEAGAERTLARMTFPLPSTKVSS